MTAPANPDTDLLCVAGGTGLAPIKAIIESVIARGGRPGKIGLYLGARTEDDLYDLGDLQALEAACPALTVIPVVSHQPNFSGIKGMVPDVVEQHLSCAGQEIFISGPGGMIRETARLLGNRADARRIRYDPPGAAR